MKILRSLMGRRQFMIAAGVTSTSALVFKKLADFVAPGFQTNVARASEMPVTPAIEGASNRYSHLLSPLKIGNKIVKNRMIHTVGSPPHFLQGPETFPADVTRSFYANVAKGAAIVLCPTVRGWQMRNRRELTGDSAHISTYDPSDPAVENYIDQIVACIHSMGSLVAGSGIGSSVRGAVGHAKIEDIVNQAKLFEDLGVDVVSMGVRNMRDENAVRSAIEQMKAVKNATNLIITMRMTVQDPLLTPEFGDTGTNTVPTLEEAITAAKRFEGLVDILQFREATARNMHPTGWNQEKGKPMSLHISQAIKESGAKMLLAPNGGFQDLDLNEEFIATGKCDMITMSRAWHADSDYGKKAYEGRGEDVVPCILCNKCHGLGQNGPWNCRCSVHPELGIEPVVRVIDSPTASKKVAVVGGGPAGMKAALVAVERGHKVTLYEKNAFLGGLLRHADFSPYKWPLKNFKDYLIRQMDKAGIEVVLNTEATPDIIRAKGYDAVMVAVGAEPIIPKIPGVDGKNVWNIVNVYGNEKKLGKNVVVIGGGEFGTGTGMHLAKAGHKTTMLTSDRELVRQTRPHYPEMIVHAYEQLDNFDFITEAITTRISEGKVTYVDAKGIEKSINADSVVIYAGLRARQDEALKFYGSAAQFLILGDCTGKGGNVQRSLRSAFSMASQI